MREILVVAFLTLFVASCYLPEDLPYHAQRLTKPPQTQYEAFAFESDTRAGKVRKDGKDWYVFKVGNQLVLTPAAGSTTEPITQEAK